MIKEKKYFVFFTDLVTTVKDGLMSAADKKKLDEVAEKANNYTHPATSGNKHIPAGGSAGKILRWSADGTAVWGDDNNTTYTEATRTQAGLMSAADKKKLDEVAEKATAVTVDAALSATSTNPVQNKIINAKLEELKKFAGDGKTAVAAAITEMGVSTATDAEFVTLAENIKKISTGVDTTNATAVAADILSGKTAYVNGTKVTGNIQSKAAVTYTPTTVDQEIAAGQYLSEKQTIKGDVNLIAGNIKKGVRIFGVTGTLEANKLQVMLGKAILQQLTLQTFDIALIDYKNSLSDRSYANWYSSALFEAARDGYGHTKLPYENGIQHTFILFETGECLHAYLYNSAVNYEWIDNQQPIFSVHIFNGDNGDSLTRYGKKDNDTNTGTFSYFEVKMVTSVRAKFYILTL